jgi:tRNA modification GTPase
MRAYLNGKIDLAKAEAIGALIHAQNELALSAASDQLQGSLSRKIESFQKELTQIAAIIEAWVDYPEEGLEFASVMDILSKLEAIQKELYALERSFRDGRIASYGINLCILGAPNVGKSSLMNALVGYNKAIVTPIAGTTRDVLEEKIRIGNLHFNVIDTAGIRETSEEIEQEGIRRSFEKAEKADLILLVLDASRPMEAREIELSKTLPAEKTITIWNKKDIGTAREGLLISAKEGTGLDELKEAIEKLIWNKGSTPKDQIMLTQERHYKAVKEATHALNLVIHGLETDLSAEFISFDLRQALKSLSSIIGTNVTEDILNEIFSKFCVGK